MGSPSVSFYNSIELFNFTHFFWSRHSYLEARRVPEICFFYGFFFDASVFDKIANQNKDQMPLRIHVNSLTGISEIVGWIRNDRMPDRSPFQLPQIKAFASGDFALDTRKIVDVRLPIDKRGVTPIDNVFLITDGLPTLGLRAPSGRKVSGERRNELFSEAIRQLPQPAPPINVVLLPMEGDPMAAWAYWSVAMYTRGSFLTPAYDWP